MTKIGLQGNDSRGRELKERRLKFESLMGLTKPDQRALPASLHSSQVVPSSIIFSSFQHLLDMTGCLTFKPFGSMLDSQLCSDGSSLSYLSYPGVSGDAEALSCFQRYIYSLIVFYDTHLAMIVRPSKPIFFACF